MAQETDSLLQEYATYPDDTGKVSLLYEMSFEFRQTNLPVAIKFAKVCYKTAQKVNNKHYLAKALNLLAVLKSQTGNNPEAIEDLSKALELRIQTRDTLSQAIILNNMGNVYVLAGDTTMGMLSYERGLKLAAKAKNERWVNGALYSMADLQISKGDFVKAEGNLYTIMAWTERSRDYEMMGLCYKTMGICKWQRGDTLAAESYLLQAIDVADMTEDGVLKADALLAQGKIYMQQNKPTKAYDCFDRSLRLSETSGQIDGIIGALQELARWYKEREMFKEAFTSLQRRDSLLSGQKKLNLAGAVLWRKEKMENKIAAPKAFSWKENIFELLMAGCMALLILLILLNRKHGKEAETR